MVKPTIAGQRPRVEGEREEEILEATLDLLLDVGYDRLTLDAVARRARASKAVSGNTTISCSRTRVV